MPTPGRLEITLKINQLPDDPSTDKNGWKSFVVDCSPAPSVRVTMRPKNWNKLVTASQTWPLWAAALTGAIQFDASGLSLPEANAAVFERKPKAAPPSPEAPPPGPPPHE